MCGQSYGDIHKCNPMRPSAWEGLVTNLAGIDNLPRLLSPVNAIFLSADILSTAVSISPISSLVTRVIGTNDKPVTKIPCTSFNHCNFCLTKLEYQILFIRRWNTKACVANKQIAKPRRKYPSNRGDRSKPVWIRVADLLPNRVKVAQFGHSVGNTDGTWPLMIHARSSSYPYYTEQTTVSSFKIKCRLTVL